MLIKIKNRFGPSDSLSRELLPPKSMSNGELRRFLWESDVVLYDTDEHLLHFIRRDEELGFKMETCKAPWKKKWTVLSENRLLGYGFGATPEEAIHDFVLHAPRVVGGYGSLRVVSYPSVPQ